MFIPLPYTKHKSKPWKLRCNRYVTIVTDVCSTNVGNGNDLQYDEKQFYIPSRG